MSVNYVAKYTLKFNNLASRGLLGVSKLANRMGKSLVKGAALGAAAMTALGVAVLAMVTRYANATDELAKFSKQTQLSVATIQGLDFAMGQSGGSAEGMRKSIQKMSKGMGELKVGTGALFTFLNKSDKAFLKQLQSVENNDQALEILTKRLAEMTDVQERAALSQAIFGRNGKDWQVIVNDGADALKRLTEEATKLRPPLTKKQVQEAEEYKDALGRIQFALKGYGDMLGGAIVPHLTRAADRVKEFLVANRELIQIRVSDFMQKIATRVKEIDFNAVATQAKQFAGGVKDLAIRTKEFIEKAGGVKGVLKLFAGLMAFIVLGQVAGAVLSIAGAMKALAIGIKLTSIVLAANPIGLLIASIALIVIGTVGLIRQHWDKIGPIVKRVGAIVSKMAQAVKSKLVGLGQVVVNVVKLILSAWGTVGKFMARVGGWFQAMGGRAKAALDSLANNVANIFTNIANTVKRAVDFMAPLWSAHWNFIRAVVTGSVAGIAKILGKLKSMFGKALKVGKKLGKGFAGVWSGIKTGVSGMVDVVKVKLARLVSWLENIKNKAVGIRDKILAGLGNDAAQARIDQRAREGAMLASKNTGRAPVFTSDAVQGVINANVSNDNAPAPDTHLTVVNEADGGTRVEKKVGNNTSVTNLPYQAKTRVAF